MSQDFFGGGFGRVFGKEGTGAEVEGKAFGVAGDGQAESEDLFALAEPGEGREGGRKWRRRKDEIRLYSCQSYRAGRNEYKRYDEKEEHQK